jgi:hypothetical protein
MAMIARAFEGMPLGIFDLAFGFPVQLLGILGPHGPHIACPGSYFLGQVTLPFWRQVAFHAVYMDPPLVIVVGGSFPGSGGMGMDVA